MGNFVNKNPEKEEEGERGKTESNNRNRLEQKILQQIILQRQKKNVRTNLKPLHLKFK